MVLASWRRMLNQRLRAFQEGTSPSRRRGRATFRPQVMVLEDLCLLAVNVSSSFIGMNQNGIASEERVEPPDTIAAIGPNSIVEAVNTSLAVFSRNGTLLAEENFGNFFSIPLDPETIITDPVVTFDEQAGRFVVGILEIDNSDRRSFLHFAVSNDSDPMHGFREKHRIETTERNASGNPLGNDYPKLGWNADAYVFTFNMLAFLATPEGDQLGPFDHVQILTIAKSSVLDADSNTISTFSTDRPNTDFTLSAATMHDSKPGDPMWFVEEQSPAFLRGDRGTIRLVRMTNVLSSSQFSSFLIPVPAYGPVAPPLQPGGTPVVTQGKIDTRILNAAVRGNLLVASENIGTGAHTLARWYEFNINTSVLPTLAQSDDIDRGRGIDTYYPAIDIAANGDLGMSFIESSPREYMSMYATGRTQADPPGVMQTPFRVKAGEDVYRGTRAGDYSGISVDPANPNSFWAANEYARTPSQFGNWGTRIANFSLNSADPNSLISRSRAFLAQVYQDVLQRPVDPVGLASWSAVLDQGMPRAEVVRAIESSVEYRTTIVQGLYRSFLGRAADPAGLNSYVGFLGSGGTAEQIELMVVNSPEYFQRRAGGTMAGFVVALYQDALGRGIDRPNFIHFSQMLTLGISPQQVAVQVLTTPEAETRAVESYYERFLQRAADSSGLSHFTSLLRLASHGAQTIVVSDQPPRVGAKEAIAQIVGSEEYFAQL